MGNILRQGIKKHIKAMHVLADTIKVPYYVGPQHKAIGIILDQLHPLRIGITLAINQVGLAHGPG